MSHKYIVAYYFPPKMYFVSVFAIKLNYQKMRCLGCVIIYNFSNQNTRLRDYPNLKFYNSRKLLKLLSIIA